MQKAIYLEWVKWGWKGSNEQTAVQKVMRERKMDFAAAKWGWKGSNEQTAVQKVMRKRKMDFAAAKWGCDRKSVV